MCIDFKIFQVKVPIIFFSARRVFRPGGMDVNLKDPFPFHT
jgi:hypothetical protein